MKPRLPKEVWIASYLYRITTEASMRMQGANADLDQNYLVMNIDPTLPRTKQQAEVAHETLHSLFDLVRGKNKPTEEVHWSEEEVCTLLAPLLVLVIQDNPALVDYLAVRD